MENELGDERQSFRLQLRLVQGLNVLENQPGILHRQLNLDELNAGGLDGANGVFLGNVEQMERLGHCEALVVQVHETNVLRHHELGFEIWKLKWREMIFEMKSKECRSNVV
jgi:hypothetical protein